MKKKLSYLTLFAISFAFVIGVTVYYFRLHFYAPQFSFPINWKEGLPFYTLFGRQLASLMVIFLLAWLSGKNLKQKIAAFLYVFGVWDIFYYLSLYIICRWPNSFLTNDLLFVIPLPWTGPVLAPMVVSLVLISLGVTLFFLDKKSMQLNSPFILWVFEIVSGGFIVLSFLWNFQAVYQGEVPTPFPWFLFISGLILGIGSFGYSVLRTYTSE